MPGNLHLKIAIIDGESRKKGHEGQIELESLGFGMQQTATAHVGHGSAAGRVAIHDLTFTKYVDKSDPTLALHCASGTHIDVATLFCEKAGGDTTVEFLKIELKQVYITSYEFQVHKEGDAAMAHGSLSFAEYTMTYTEQEAAGTAGAQTVHGFNVAENRKA